MGEYFYSKHLGGFGNIRMFGASNIPADAVEVTDQERLALLLGESAGQLITTDEKGFPVLKTPPIAEVDVRERIAFVRYERETAGITFNGAPVHTDRMTQSRLDGMSRRAAEDAAYTTDWKLADGTFVLLDASEVVKMADAVDEYVQACFTRERELLTALNNDVYDPDMLADGWPGQLR
ncbi:DUF4376 domain-containing protein [Pseudomonas sp. RIT-PI-S]|uniref:DUF4376 domain-containing protein n=1 Tax=Pseudomonas sp. RIT-PI-S TaxID=3035295 RepID=UPI0021DB7D0F|nr:DUF4376 domain-containing protein [Pseudomonas sp. RIT-PI-S]